MPFNIGAYDNYQSQVSLYADMSNSNRFDDVSVMVVDEHIFRLAQEAFQLLPSSRLIFDTYKHPENNQLYSTLQSHVQGVQNVAPTSRTDMRISQQ